MKKIQFPVARHRKPCFPREALCPMCKKQKVLEPRSMVVVNLGAILMTDREKGCGTMSDGLDGFLRFIWHGAHDGGVGKDAGRGVTVDIVDDVRGGQADLYFCSADCLREFFNACVDELERKMKTKRRSHSNKTLHRTHKRARSA